MPAREQLPVYTLHYFDLRGMGEATRLLLEVGSLKYKNRFVERWGKEKRETPFGQVPVLEFTDEDGKEVHLAQSTAINRFVARRGGLWPKDDIGAAVVDGVVEACTELRGRTAAAIFAPSPEHRAAARKTAVTELIPQFARAMERRLRENGDTGYFWGPEITPADVTVYTTVHIVRAWLPTPGTGEHDDQGAEAISEKGAPAALLKALRTVEQHPRIKAYYASDRAPNGWVAGPELIAKVMAEIAEAKGEKAAESKSEQAAPAPAGTAAH